MKNSSPEKEKRFPELKEMRDWTETNFKNIIKEISDRTRKKNLGRI